MLVQMKVARFWARIGVRQSGHPMQKLDYNSYLALREGAKVLEKDGFGDKVLHLTDGTFIKLFRRKRLLSSAAIWPYAQRFADNAKKLEQLGIPCPKVIGVYRIAEIQRDIVHYHPLPGLTLRQLRNGEGNCPDDIRERFWKFVDKVHDLGIYFRSMHLGNVVLTPEGELGLIDISDMQIRKKSLGKQLRTRNLAHIKKLPEEAAWLKP